MGNNLITSLVDIRKGTGKFGHCQMCHDTCVVYQPVAHVTTVGSDSAITGPLDNKGHLTCLFCMTRVLKEIQNEEPGVSITLDGEAL